MSNATRRSRNTNLNRLLSSKNKGAYAVSGPKGVLAHIFRSFLDKLNIDAGRWELLGKRYQQRTGSDKESNRQKSSDMSNLTKALYAREMTWITFMRGLDFLGAIKIEFTAKAYFRGGRVVEHTTGFEMEESPIKIDDDEN